MKKQNLFPDYIAIDGSEGGTGAAPKTFMDDLGYPLFPALKKTVRLIREQEVENKFKIITSGKLISGGKTNNGSVYGGFGHLHGPRFYAGSGLCAGP